MSSFCGRDDGLRLVQEAVAGCPRSFARLWGEYRAVVHAVLLAYVPSRDADELLDRVRRIAARTIPGLALPAEFAPRLLGIARRLGRQHGARPGALRGLLYIHSNLDGERLLSIIRSLDVGLREPLVLRLVLGLAGTDIARLMGLPGEQVRHALAEGLRCVRNRLEEAV